MTRWPTKKLGELCDVVAGGTPSRTCSDFYDGGIPWVKIGDMLQGTVIETEETISRNGLENSAAKLLPPGTVLISIFATIGRTAVLGIEAATNQAIAGVIPKNTDKLSPSFLRYFLDYSALELITRARGVAQLNINGRILKSINIPVPPLPEQERIVKLLDEADALRKLRAQAHRRAADLIPALFHEMFGDPETNPKGWPKKLFGKLVSNQDGKRKPVKASHRLGRKGVYPYYGASGIIDYVDGYLFDGESLLIGEDGANLLTRSTPIAFLAYGKYWVNNHAHVVADNGNADLDYLCAHINLRDLTDYITGSAQPKLNQGNMNRLLIPVPPLPLQKEFAERVAEIRAMETAQAESRKKLDALFQSLLHRAFAGEI